MSKISTIYDQIHTALAALYPNHTIIPNAISLTDNMDNLLVKGYGLKVGPQTAIEHEFNNFATEREFIVVFTREVPRMDISQSEFQTYEKELLEDIYIVQNDFYNVDQIGIEASISKIDLGPVSPVEFVRGEKNNFISTEASFLFAVREVVI